MKKVKYLFLFLLLGLGLSSCFGIDVEIVNSYYFDGNEDIIFTSQPVYSYLYRFNNICSSWEYGSYTAGCLGYGLYSNKLLSEDKFCISQSNYNCNTSYSSTYFNGSAFESYLYTGYIKYRGNNPNCANGNMSYNVCINNSPSILLGTNTNFGNNVIYTSLYDTNSPKYFIGGGSFLTGSDWEDLKLSDIGNSIRFFFNSTTGNNIISNTNLISPLGWYSSFAWEYFTNSYTRTNYGYYADSNGKHKGKHFGLFDLSYSFVYNNLNGYTNDYISRNGLRFATVSLWGPHIMNILGNLSYSDLTSSSRILFSGYLVLKRQRTSTNGNEGTIIISKNPNNFKQLLFQEFSCQQTNMNYLSQYSGCVVLSQGLLKLNGSTDVLPFTDTTSLLKISDYPILSYLFDTSSTMLGGTYINGNQICLSDNPTGNGICFDKVSTSDSIKDDYLSGVSTDVATSTIINSNLAYRCINDSQFAIRNAFCSYYINLYQNPVAIGSGYYSNITPDGSGGWEVVISDAPYLFDGTVDYGITWIQDENGNWLTNCSGGWCSTRAPGFLTGYVVSGTNYGTGITSDYFDFSNNSTGIFFKCPWPLDSYIADFGIFDFEFSNNYFLMPINCMISAFQHGKSFNFFDEVGLFNFGPLINGDSSLHKTLFHFFDFLLMFGLFLLLRFFTKLGK